MQEMYIRTELLVGSEKMNKLKGSAVLICGLGGVGGYIAEALARAGVGTLGICDFDKVDPSNLNRQVLSTVNNIGELKTDAAEKRILSINPDCRIIKYPIKLTEELLTELNIMNYNFVADAIDDVPAKTALICKAYELNVPIICSMGTGNKIDPFKYKIVPIEKTEGDPLARKMRRNLKELGIKKLPVLYSDEPKQVPDLPQGSPIPTISYMPAVAGLMIASYIIRNIIEKE